MIILLISIIIILDVLQTAGVIPNDSQKYVIGLVDMVVFDKASPRVEVTV